MENETHIAFFKRLVDGLENSNHAAEQAAARLFAISQTPELGAHLEEFVGFTECNMRYSEYGDGYDMKAEISAANKIIEAYQSANATHDPR